MPEAIISALAAYVGGTAAATVIVYGVMIAVSLAVSNQQRISMQRKARDAYNGSLEDRTVTIRGATVPKRIVLGRARVGGVLQYVATTGENKDKLAMVIALAGHEIDAVETVYFNDDPVTLDASGYVTSAPYNMTVPVSASAALVAGSVTLPHTPITDSVHVTYWDSTNFVSVAPAFTVVGSVVSVTGSPPAGDGTVNYQYQNTDIAVTSKARVLIHLGSPSQTVDTVLQALLPTEWDSTHRGQGIAYLVCLFGYDQDAFPSGLPNVSAVVRGAKCYDPRSATTVWTQNPALCLRHYALHALGGRLASGSLIDAEVNTAANICDASVTYTVGGVPETRALYTCGTMADTKAQPIDVIAELAQAMAGRAAFAGNKLHIRAGAYVAPVLSLGDGDFATVMSEGAEQSTPITVQPRTPREALFNIVTGSFADPGQGWKVIDTPRVEATAYITEDGTELPLEVQWNAVNHVGQCQQLSAVMLRQARQALTIVATFKLSAYAVELFDTVAITCTRYGWSAKAFEVLGRKWSIGGGIELTLRETASSVYDFGTAFDAVDAAPNTLLPSPLVVPAVTGLSAASGTEWLMRQADGSIVSRLHVSWTAVTEEAVVHNGHIEVRYGLATEPEANWTSVQVPGSDAESTFSGVQDGAYYIVKARASNALARGAWCTQIAHQIIGKTAVPADVATLTGEVVKGRITWTWTPCPNIDYGATELRLGGASWAAATTPAAFRGAANSFSLVVSGTGTYTAWVKHVDTSGNYSATAQGFAVTVDASDLVVDGVTYYIHLKYSNDGGTSFTGNGGEDVGAYLGTRVDTTPSDSSTPGDYTWALIKGSDGTNGTPGAAGADGTPSYLHVKWSNDGGLHFTEGNGESAGIYIGTLTNSTLADSTTPGDYTWALVRVTDASLGMPLTSWTLNGQAIADVSDGKVGNHALRLTEVSNGYPNQGNFIAIDKTKVYQVKFWARPSSDCTGHLYFCLRQWDDLGTTAGPSNGGRDPYKPSNVSRAVHNAQFGTDQWGEYIYTWTATDWQDAGVKFFQPEFLDNYMPGGGAVGHWDIQGITIREITDLQDALDSAEAAQATADGKIVTFFQNDAPTATSLGDLWFDTNDNNKQYRWSGSSWVAAADVRIGNAVQSASDAQATADGKVTTFVSASAPTAEAVGDLWIDSDDGNKLYRWSGSSWTAYSWDTGSLASNAATEWVEFYDATGVGYTNYG